MNRTITAKQVEFFSQLLGNYGLEDHKTWVDYSGRGMYGDKCLGVVVNSPDHWPAASLAMELTMSGKDNISVFEVMEIMSRLPVPRIDSMSYRVIIYWPDIKVVD